MISYHGRRAWQIETEDLRVTVLECGGHVAELVYKAVGDINPLWVQNRPTIDSDQFDSSIHGPIYGTDSEAKLISGLLGHNLCFPYWGPPSPSEEAAGMTFHGETNIRRWEGIASSPNTLKLAVTLPDASIRFEREIRCEGQIAYFSEAAHNLSAWDRQVGWCEHVTFGPPFLEAHGTTFASNLKRGFRTADPSRREFTWPHGEADDAYDLAGFDERQGSDLVNSFLVDSADENGYFVACNARLGLLVGYIFWREEFPWINVWESNNTERQTRGMEFSNTPIEGTCKRYAGQEQIWGVPTYQWLDAKASMRKKYAAFSSAISPEFTGVANITISGSKLRIEEKRTGNTLFLHWAPAP